MLGCMSEQQELVTVFRSMDESAEEDCEAIRDLLAAQSISVEVLDDSAPDVPEGTYEVRVPAADAARAEQLIGEHSRPGDNSAGDNSDALDLEMVFQAGGGTSSEMEAMNVKNLLESNGIEAVLVGDSVLPNFPFEVRVARDQAELARQVIAEAEQPSDSDSES
jgi:Putative prokaryotic signal transducing protein